jgi:heavy metal efflux system protein
VQRPVFYAIAIIITAYLPIFTLQAVEGRLFRPMAWTVAFALAGRCSFPSSSLPFWPFAVSARAKEWKNPVMEFLRSATAWRDLGYPSSPHSLSELA